MYNYYRIRSQARKQSKRDRYRNKTQARIERGRPFDNIIQPLQLLHWFIKLSGLRPVRLETSRTGTIYFYITADIVVRLANHPCDNYRNNVIDSWCDRNLNGFSEFVKEIPKITDTKRAERA